MPRKKRRYEDRNNTEVAAATLMATARDMQKSNSHRTAQTQTEANKDDVARIILMLETWQDTDSLTARHRAQDRAAWSHIAKAQRVDEKQAKRLFRAAETQLNRQSKNNEPPQKALIDLMTIAAEADEELLVDSMAAFLTALSTGTHSKPSTSRMRHGINKLIAKHGPKGHAAYTIWRAKTRSIPYQDRCMPAWDRAATAVLRAWPAPAAEWLRVLADPGLTRSSQITLNTAKGTEVWSGPEHAATKTKGPTAMGTWNVNSFFRRWTQGDFAAFMAANPIDVLHVTETRGSTLRCEGNEVRRILASQGFHWVAWNWNVNNESHHGSAVFSRYPMKVEFGTRNDGSDKEGRVITTHFDNGPSVIWVYSPCSTMNEAEPEDKRTTFDTELRSHARRVQTEQGAHRVLMAGDFNVAPLEHDSNIPMITRPTYPSTKDYEIKGYEDLLNEGNLINVAEQFSSRPAKTWRKKGYGHAMRLDHVLAPKRKTGTTTDASPHIIVDTYRVAQSLHKSDHHPVLFTVTNEGAQATGAGSQGAAPTAASKPFSPRRQVPPPVPEIGRRLPRPLGALVV